MPPRRNCNTPATCSLDVAGALKFLAGTTAQCDPQALERNPTGLITDTPAGIKSQTGADGDEIFLPEMGQNSQSAQVVLVLDANGRLKGITPTQAGAFGVPVYMAGAVTIQDLSFILQNFNSVNVTNVGSCDFDVAVWAQCTTDAPLSLKKISFAEFVSKLGMALLLDAAFISGIDEAVLSCTTTPTVTTITSLFGCLNGVKGQLLAGAGANELVSFNGVFQAVARGLSFYPFNGNIVAVSGGAQNVTYVAPSPPWPTVIPNGIVYGVFQTEVAISTNGGHADVSLNGLRLNHTEAPVGENAASYQFMVAPVGQSMTFNITTPNSASFLTTVKLMGFLY